MSAVFLLTAVLAGCAQEEQIERYAVEKPPARDVGDQPPRSGPAERLPPGGDSHVHPTQAAAEQELRLLGAIIAGPSRYWFFKLIGPVDAVAPHARDFTRFVKSIRLDPGEDSSPRWELPEGWRQEPGRGMRLATIKLGPADAALEMSVIPLSFAGPDAEGYLLSNVNRWRQQVGLSSIDAARLPARTERIELAGGTALVVDVQGPPASDGANSVQTGRNPGGGDAD